MTAPVHTDFVRAFTADTVFRNSKGREFPVRQLDAGELVLTTGHILACDPGYLQLQGPQSLRAYTRTVPVGRYPVSVCLAHVTYPKYTQELVAAAMVRFTDAEPVAWEMALTPGQDPATLLPGHFFGYGVDGGRGCFTDADILNALAPERAQFGELVKSGVPQTIQSFGDIRKMMTPFFQRLHDGFFGALPTRGVSRHTTVVANPESGLNLIAFQSGEGDGCYPSFWGLDARGNPCCLATDFMLLLESFEESIVFPLGGGKRSFVHQELIDREITSIELQEEVEDPPPKPFQGESLDYKFSLLVRFVGRGSINHVQLRVGGREYHYRMACGQEEYLYYLDQSLDDAELVVKYTARTVAL